MGERAQYAIVLWAGNPGTVTVVQTEDIGYNRKNELMAKWGGQYWKVQKILEESDDLHYLAKKDFSVNGTPWRGRGRPKKIKKPNDFDTSLLSAAVLSDDDNVVTPRTPTYPVIEDSDSGLQNSREQSVIIRKKREGIGKIPFNGDTRKSSRVSPTIDDTKTPLTSRKRPARVQDVDETDTADDTDVEDSDEDGSEKEESVKLDDEEQAEDTDHIDSAETSAASTPINENSEDDEDDDIEDTTLRNSRRREGLNSSVPRNATAPARPTKDADVIKTCGGALDYRKSVKSVTQKNTVPSQHPKDAGAIRTNEKVQAHDELINLKRSASISHIYTLSDGETDDENEIPRTTKSKRNLLRDEKEDNLLPPARRRGHEIEIYPNTEVFVKKRLFRHALLNSGNKPGDFVCLLIRFLLGEKLKAMTVQGGKNKDAIPKSVYNAVRWAVNSLVQKDDRLDEKDYKRIVTQLCTRSRSKNLKEKPLEESNNGLQHAGVNEERTNKNSEPSERAQKSTSHMQRGSHSDQPTIPPKTAQTSEVQIPYQKCKNPFWNKKKRLMLQ